mgnify:CR=1 FL=1
MADQVRIEDIYLVKYDAMNDNDHLHQTSEQISDDGKEAVRLDAFFQEGHIAHQAGNIEEAEASYRRVLVVNPDHSDANHFLGVIALQVGKADDALVLIAKAIGINSENALYHHSLGIALEALGRLDEAIDRHKEALSLSPDLSQSHNRMGLLLRKQGHFEDALTCFDKAVITNSGFSEAYFNRGVLLQKMGQNLTAAENYQKALSINPDFDEAKANLKSLSILPDDKYLESAVVSSITTPPPTCNLLIATVPRSGTHYMEQLFQALAIFYTPYPGKNPIKKTFPAPHVASYPNLGIDKFCAGHTACPNIEETLEGDQLKKWHSLSYFNPGHDIFLKLLKTIPQFIDVFNSGEGFDFNDKKSRIVFIYRNPLDHFISYYNSRPNHVDDSTRGYFDIGGSFHFFENIEDFIFKGGLDSYLKLYASYIWSMPKYGDRIMIISYESLVKDPYATMSNILDFVDSAPDPRRIPNELDLAVASSAPRVIRLLEQEYECTLGMDQHPTDKPTSHIRNGGSGNWKTIIGRNAIRKIECRFNEFEFTLKDFDIDADLDELLSGEEP